MHVYKFNSGNACTETKWLRKLVATEDDIENTEPFNEKEDIQAWDEKNLR